MFLPSLPSLHLWTGEGFGPTGGAALLCTLPAEVPLFCPPREPSRMSRSLNVLFRRDPSRDRQDNQIHFEGYQFFWPDGRPLAVGLDAFCKHGQQLLGLR